MILKLQISKIKIQQELVRGRFEDFMDDLIDDKQLQLADKVDSELAKYHNFINKLIDDIEKEQEIVVIRKSPTAGVDLSKIDQETLDKATDFHKHDVQLGMDYFAYRLQKASLVHDNDKNSSEFYQYIKSKFKDPTWFEGHKRKSRHHLTSEGGVPEDVNLVDVIECIVDCVMAGSARSEQGVDGVYDVEINPKILTEAVKNTVKELKSIITVKGLEE